ncbi:glycosyltransferase family 2 protein [uncultured Alistipes sp.]|uniref:glycosyltransferase family 2 protein n=1 Tax=Bacteroides acidifaciens TaxID=85831 RepID=UPI0025EAE296|nr:glycosyltransferase family 2 protein [uncultured Alistipes sp.]
MKIGVVLLNYNSYADTIHLVEELQKQSVADRLRIVVVDNHSPDDSYRQLLPLQRTYPHVTVLRTERNEGYARGNNVGLNFLRQQGEVDYVAVMNSDIVLLSDCLERLVEEYNLLPDACLIAPLQVMLDGRVYLGNSLPRFRDDLKNLFYLYRYWEKRESIKRTATEVSDIMPKIIPVDIVPGSLMFASMERFSKIGFFYPGTFLFVEERFVAHAARSHGYRNYILTDRTYLHAHSQTINKACSSFAKYRYQYQGWLLYTRHCRRFGCIKAAFLWLGIQYSLLEIKAMDMIKKAKKTIGNKW